MITFDTCHCSIERRTKCQRFALDGSSPTEIVILFTYISKMEARMETTPDGEKSYLVSTLLGRQDTETEVYGRKLIEITSATAAKPLLLALALKQTSLSTFKHIINLVRTHIQ